MKSAKVGTNDPFFFKRCKIMFFEVFTFDFYLEEKRQL